MTACIVGWSHTPFGKHEDQDVETLIVRAATDAMSDAGIAPEDVDEILLGHYGGGFSGQGFTSSLVLQANDAFPFYACDPGGERLRHRFRRGPPGPEINPGRNGPLSFWLSASRR